jgi:hypothetical protein
MSPSESWTAFDRQLTAGSLHAKLAADPTLAHQVALLSNIAAEPQTSVQGPCQLDGWPQDAEGLAAANSRLGPTYPSKPY